MKIAFLFSTLEGYGLVKIAFTLIKELKHNYPVEIHAITLSKEPENSMIDAFKQENIPVHSLNMSRIKGMFYAQKALARLVNKEQFNILHSHGFRANLIHHQIKKLIPKTKEVMTVHLDPKDDAKHPLGPLFSLWRTNKHTNIIREADNIVACSKSVSKSLEKYNIHISAIQNGIEIPSLQRNKTMSDLLKKDLGISGKTVSIVISGLHPRKNIKTIIEVYNKLGNSYPLLIIGEGSVKKELEESANSNILFLGFKKNIIPYLQIADLYISASYSEGLPLSVLEAMSNQVIPILSSIDPHKEIVQNSCFENYLFDCDDTGALYKICNSLLNQKDGIEELKVAAREIIINHFSAQRMAKDYYQLYLSCK